MPTQTTIAEGIAIAEPIRDEQILQAVRETGGSLLAVSEEQIIETLALLHRQGFYVEPTSAAVIAGAKRVAAREPPGAVLASVLTGHGLKAGETLAKL